MTATQRIDREMRGARGDRVGGTEIVRCVLCAAPGEMKRKGE